VLAEAQQQNIDTLYKLPPLRRSPSPEPGEPSPEPGEDGEGGEDAS
jgi:hypothetical protein